MLFEEPILVLVTVYLSVVYGVIYALFEALPVIFVERHGLTVSQDGLIFIGVAIGAVFGAIVNQYCLRDYPALLKEWRGFPPAEKRLEAAMVGGPEFGGWRVLAGVDGRVCECAVVCAGVGDDPVGYGDQFGVYLVLGAFVLSP